MGLFGEAEIPQQGISNDNPLGIQAPEDVAANPGEPENNVTAGNENNVQDNFNGNQNAGNVNQPLEQNQQELDKKNNEEPIESIDLNDSYERKVSFIKQKFNGAEDFEKSINELESKLGKPDNKELKSSEEAINYYISLEKEMGSNSNINNPETENQQLRQELNGLRNMVQQLTMQNLQGNQGQINTQNNQRFNQPMRDPNTGQFIPQNNAQQFNGQNQQNASDDIDISFDDVDVDKFMSEFYEKGPNAESFKKILLDATKSVSEKIADKKLQQITEKQQQERQAEQQKQAQAQQLKANYDIQVNKIKQQYGEQEFDKYKNQMSQLFNKYPMYLNPQMFPNGFEIVFNEAKQMANNYQSQQNNLQNQQQYNAVQKMTARMPKPSNNIRFDTKKLSQDDIEKAQIFSSAGQGGIWG